MVPTEKAKVEVLDANGKSMRSLFPEDDGNGLSEELFACNTVDRVLPFTGLHLANTVWYGTL